MYTVTSTVKSDSFNSDYTERIFRQLAKCLTVSNKYTENKAL